MLPGNRSTLSSAVLSLSLLCSAVTGASAPRRMAVTPSHFAIPHLVNGPAGTEIMFPGTDMRPVRPELFQRDLSRDHIQLSDRETLKLIVPRESAAPSVRITGQAPITFGKFLTDSGFWTHPEINDSRYQLSEDGYHFFGLAKAHGHVYVGVCWYSPSASDLHSVRACIFQTCRIGNKVAFMPVRKVTDFPDNYDGDSPLPPLMDSLPDGDLLVVESHRMSILKPSGQWITRRISTLTPDNPLNYFWLRGPYLIACQMPELHGFNNSPTPMSQHYYRVKVLDILTRRVLYRFQWLA